jgi:hypothetical protein
MRAPKRDQPVAVTVYITDHLLRPGESVTAHPAATQPGIIGPVAPARASRGAFRVAGIVVLLLALACLVAINRAQGERVAGQPVATWPQPPPVGTCLDLDGGTPRSVPCAGPHDAEVTRAFGALNPIVTDTSRDPMYDACDAAAADYLGPSAHATRIPGSPDWDFLPLAYRTGPVDAPSDQRAGRYGWMVCVLQPAAPARYSGTVRGIPVTAAPVAYRWCLDHRNSPVSCAAPHATEILATLDPERASAPQPGARPTQDVPDTLADSLHAVYEQRSRWLDGCADLAGTLTGATDPTYGGVLTVGVSPLSGVLQELQRGGAGSGRPGPGSGSTPGQRLDAGATAPALQACITQVRDGRQLTGSVIGRGDAPPPLTDR